MEWRQLCKLVSIAYKLIIKGVYDGVPRCGSEKIEVGIFFGTGNNVQKVGLNYKALFVTEIEPVCSDVCMECGVILISYINIGSNAKHKWHKRNGT